MSIPTVPAQSGLTGTSPVAVSAAAADRPRPRHDLLLPGGGDQPDGHGQGRDPQLHPDHDDDRHDEHPAHCLPNPSTVGQALTFAATVTVPEGAGVATGAVTFLEGTVVLGTGSLDEDNLATFSTSTLAAGDHTVTAVYDGDASFAASSSNAVNVTINAPVLAPQRPS